MKKSIKRHSELVKYHRNMKASKKSCQRLGINYKENPYCIGLNNNYAKELYPCLRYIK